MVAKERWKVDGERNNSRVISLTSFYRLSNSSTDLDLAKDKVHGIIKEKSKPSTQETALSFS